MEEPQKPLKYIEIKRSFETLASETRIRTKQSQATLERLAKHLARQKPKDGPEFERVEFLKDFVVKTADANESVLKLLGMIHKGLTDIYEDVEALCNVAFLQDRVKDQSEVILMLMAHRDELIKQLYEKRGGDTKYN
jgi:hypothetical protein